MAKHLPDTAGKFVVVKVSPGEFYDRLAILDIKRHNLPDNDGARAKVEHMRAEWLVFGGLSGQDLAAGALNATFEELLSVHANLWNLEEKIRKALAKTTEAAAAETDFKQEVVDLYAEICACNSKRHKLKADIDKCLKAEEYTEPKNYTESNTSWKMEESKHPSEICQT